MPESMDPPENLKMRGRAQTHGDPNSNNIYLDENSNQATLKQQSTETFGKADNATV